MNTVSNIDDMDQRRFLTCITIGNIFPNNGTLRPLVLEQELRTKLSSGRNDAEVANLSIKHHQWPSVFHFGCCESCEHLLSHSSEREDGHHKASQIDSQQGTFHCLLHQDRA